MHMPKLVASTAVDTTGAGIFLHQLVYMVAVHLWFLRLGCPGRKNRKISINFEV